MGLLNDIFFLLEEIVALPAKHKPHKLSGNYKGFWECHVQPDWLLIWLQDDTEQTIELTRTVSHADLF
jgi:mRNA interferase YafQ